MIAATLDTGALIAIEKRKPRGIMLLRAAKEHRAELVVITPVLTEWWRGRSDRREDVLAVLTVVPFPPLAAKAAGIALGVLGDDARGLTVDAMIMAFASLRGGGVVYTGDLDDLTRLSGVFPSVRILSV